MVATLLGMGIGAGLWLTLIGLRPPTPSPDSVLASLRKTSPDMTDRARSSGSGSWTQRAGRPAVSTLKALGLPTARSRRDLMILDRDEEDLLASQFAVGASALLLGPLAGAWFAVLGVPLPVPVLLAGTVVGSAVMFWVPVLLLASDAEQARAELRDSLSLFLDLVGSVLAGGGGVEQSLADAASIGDLSTHRRLREALTKARLARMPIPAVLAELAERLDSPDLRETASSLRLAGSEGSRVREALAAKAGALRVRRLAEAKEYAETATERAGLPVAVMFVGFLVTIGFPAVTKVLVGLR